MADKTPPRLMRSPLTGQVYVVTRYTVKPSESDPTKGYLVAHTKYDVTEDFNVIVNELYFPSDQGDGTDANT
jgi:hypothetical protein